MTVSVCLSLCLSVSVFVRDRIFETARPIFINFVRLVYSIIYRK